VTINRAVQRLHALLARAVEWKVLEKHPFSGLKPLRYDKSGRVRYLTADEETQLREALFGREAKLREARDRFNSWRAARGRQALPRRTEEFVDYLRPVVLVALNTGLRRGEILQLEWKDVDLDGKWITVSGAIAKNGQTRRMPLNAEAVALLQAWRQFRSRRASAARVSPGSDGEGLQRKNFRFHDLRHHFASRLVQSGIDLNTVRELLGHADITMVLRYAHMSPDRLAMAVERVVRAAEPAPHPRRHDRRGDSGLYAHDLAGAPSMAYTFVYARIMEKNHAAQSQAFHEQPESGGSFAEGVSVQRDGSFYPSAWG